MELMNHWLEPRLLQRSRPRLVGNQTVSWASATFVADVAPSTHRPRTG